MIRLTPRLCRAARALAGFEQKELALASGVSKSTIGAFETKSEKARLAAMNNRALVEAFEGAGLVFILEDGGGPGLRFGKGPLERCEDGADIGAMAPIAAGKANIRWKGRSEPARYFSTAQDCTFEFPCVTKIVFHRIPMKTLFDRALEGLSNFFAD